MGGDLSKRVPVGDDGGHMINTLELLRKEPLDATELYIKSSG